MTTDKMTTATIRASAQTDVGPVRTLNEDNFEIEKDLNLFIVADGMGGHDAGEVASKKAIDALVGHIADSLSGSEDTLIEGNSETVIDDDSTLVDEPNPAVDTIAKAIASANERVHEINSAKGYPDGSGMGTTIAGIWIHHDCEFVISFHVGDSRIYRYRDDTLMQLSRDHTLHQFWADNGQQGDEPQKNIILKAIGPWEETSADINIHGINNNDLFMICSDGLTGPVNDEAIAATLKEATSDNLDVICDKLVNMAITGGGTDNVTIIICRCKA